MNPKSITFAKTPSRITEVSGSGVLPKLNNLLRPEKDEISRKETLSKVSLFSNSKLNQFNRSRIQNMYNSVEALKPANNQQALNNHPDLVSSISKASAMSLVNIKKTRKHLNEAIRTS